MATRINQRTDSDCLRACIASLFELTYDQVPDFPATPDALEGMSVGMAQDVELAEWLAKRGLGFIRLPEPKKAIERGAQSARLPWGLCIGVGGSPRGDWLHCVVMDARENEREPEVIHDPHPSRAGLNPLRGIEEYIVLVVLDPAVRG